MDKNERMSLSNVDTKITSANFLQLPFQFRFSLVIATLKRDSLITQVYGCLYL